MPSVTRRSKRGRAERRAEIEQSLLEGTERLLSEGASFTELSVERLVAEAGISRSTFYVYFTDKGHLIRELTEDVMGQLYDAGAIWWDRGADATREDIRRSMGAVVDVYRRHDSLMAAVVDTAVYDPEVRTVFGALMERYVTVLSGVIDQGQERGFIATDVPARETAEALSWMAERSCYQVARGADRDRQDRLADALTAVVWNTLYSGGPAQAAG